MMDVHCFSAQVSMASLNSGYFDKTSVIRGHHITMSITKHV